MSHGLHCFNDLAAQIIQASEAVLQLGGLF